MARRKKMTRTVTMYTYLVGYVNVSDDSVGKHTYTTNQDLGENAVQKLREIYTASDELKGLIPFSAVLENMEEEKYWMYEDDFISHAHVVENKDSEEAMEVTEVTEEKEN